MPRRKLTTYEKCENYLTRTTIKHGGEVQHSFSTKSIYFEINGRKLRLSDHTTTVASDESGMVSIIAPSNDTEQFIIQCHGSNKMSIVDYKRIKEFIRTFAEMPMVFSKTVINGYEFAMKEPPKTNGMDILGIPVKVFTDGQLKLIKGITRKAATENGLKFNL